MASWVYITWHCFSTLHFCKVRMCGKCCCVYVGFSIGVVIVLWVFWKHFACIFVGNNKWNITCTHHIFPDFLRKDILYLVTFYYILYWYLVTFAKTRKILWVALQNLTESHVKNQLPLSKHSENFGFRL